MTQFSMGRALDPRIAWAPSDDGRASDGVPGEGTGGSVPPTEATPSQPTPEPPGWASQLQGGITELTGVMRNLMQLAQVNQEQQTAARTQAREADPPPVDPAQLETLNRKEFSDHIVNQVLRAVNKQVVEPLNQRIEMISANTTRGELQRMVETAASQHKDFGEWRQEMIGLAGTYKGLPPEALYHLARAGNPEKVAEVDRRYNPPAAKAEPVRLRSFGGLTPSQSGTGNRGQRMNGQEAADAAWAEAIKGAGGEPLFDE